MIPVAPSRHSPAWRPSLPVRTFDARVLKRVPARHSIEWNPYYPGTLERYYSGIGRLGQSDTQLTQEGISLATTGVTAGALIAGATTIGAVAGPIGAIAGVLVGILSQVFSGCGQSCVLTSDAANQIEQALQQNLAVYLSSGHTKSEQAAALANFDNTWAKLKQYCGQASFGSAGQNCIADRQAGSCKWKTSPGGWQQSGGVWNYVYPGAAGSGSTCWNWFVGYRDPIANDPTVVPDEVSPSTATASTGNSVATEVQNVWGTITSPSTIGPLLLIAGIVLLAVML